ncbi:MAG: TolC family protein, partial [Calditrichia bacterium]
MIKLSAIGLLAFIIAYPLRAFSQAESYDLKALLEMAVRRNADIRVQTAETSIAGKQKWQAVTRWLPRIGADASYMRTSTLNGVPSFVAANAAIEKYGVLDVQQKIFDVPAWLALRESAINKRRQKYVFSGTRQQVLFNVIQSYFNTLKAKGQITAYQENLKAFQLIYQQSRILYQNGVVAEIDVKKSLAELLLQKNSLLMAQRDHQIALDQLKVLVNMPVSEEMEITEFPMQVIHLDSSGRYVEMALQDNPDLQVQQTEQAIYSARKTGSLLQHLPSANASFYYGWDTANRIGWDNRGWQALVNVSLPLWHWGSLFTDRQIADLRCQQSGILMQQLQRQVMRQVLATYRECQIQQQQRKAMEQSRDQAQQALDMARIGYRE